MNISSLASLSQNTKETLENGSENSLLILILAFLLVYSTLMFYRWLMSAQLNRFRKFKLYVDIIIVILLWIYYVDRKTERGLIPYFITDDPEKNKLRKVISDFVIIVFLIIRLSYAALASSSSEIDSFNIEDALTKLGDPQTSDTIKKGIRFNIRQRSNFVKKVKDNLDAIGAGVGS